MWVNVLDTGGRQAMHNHANSFCRWRGVPDAAPPTAGKRRNTMAFNAIPTRLDSWGHAITFGG